MVSTHTILDQADGLDDTKCSEQRYFFYDLPDPSPLLPAGYEQKYLLGKLSKSWNADHTMWYSYDRFGRIIWTVQYIPELTKTFTIDYTYDFNGNVLKVDYQKDVPAERFVHHYAYDADMQLVEVQTSTDGISQTAQLQAKYDYYHHGPLKRTELGDENQGLDFVYTIQGQLKSLNDPNLDTGDPGADGYAGLHSNFAEDVFGYSLDYFSGDYLRGGTAVQTYSNELNDGSGLIDQFNGNIKTFRWRTRTELVNGGSAPLSGGGNPLHDMYGYNYDLLNRLTSAQFGSSESPSSGTTTLFSASEDYKVSNLTYDENGNILSLDRNAYMDAGPPALAREMDNLSYHYQDGTNRLIHVNDLPSNSSNWTSDIDDQAGFNPSAVGTWRYGYNLRGQLTREGTASNSRYFDYDAYGKIHKISGDEAHSQPHVLYTPDENGWRLKKTIYDPAFAVKRKAGTSAIIWVKSLAFMKKTWGEP